MLYSYYRSGELAFCCKRDESKTHKIKRKRKKKQEMQSEGEETSLDSPLFWLSLLGAAIKSNFVNQRVLWAIRFFFYIA